MAKTGLTITEDVFHYALGAFYSGWSAVEAFVDFGLGKFLKLPHDETHLLTSVMEFSRKATVLRGLVIKSKDSQKEKIIIALNWLQNESNRNLFAHSTVQIYEDKIVFFERQRQGRSRPKQHPYTAKEFLEHVRSVALHSLELSEGLGSSDEELEKFLDAASSVKRSS